MGTETLVDGDLRAGSRVVEVLDEAAFPYRAAFSYHAAEYDDWRLLIATPLVETIGASRAYWRVHTALKKNPDTLDFPRNWIWLVPPSHPAVRSVARAIHMGRKREVRSTPTRYTGLRTHDAVVYHIRAR